MSVTCYVGLGSNVDDRLGHLQAAVDAMRATEGVEVVRLSSVYDTDPVGPPQPDFLNAVAEITTTLGPHELLTCLKTIEQRLGRRQGERWGPRDIDLDLLLYGDATIESDDLRVPHPEMAGRPFVLVPLADLKPAAAATDGSTAGVRKTDQRLT